MSDITNISIDVLKVHPRNQEFFDDISGADYERFKSSIKEDGIIVEIIVAPDMTILSGHQRYKAAKELGFTTVPVRIKEDVASEDQKLKFLLVTNFGRQENDKSKQRKIADEYVRLCGYEKGGDRKSNVQNGHLKLSEIAAQLNMTEGSLRRSLRIERNLSEDMKRLLDDGIISETFAADVIAGMSEEEQIKFVSELDATKKYTAKELQPLVDEIKQLKENPPLPEDYEEVKKAAKEYKEGYEVLEKDFKSKVAELQEVRKQLNAIQDSSPEAEFNNKLKNSCLTFCSRVADFVEKIGGYVWLTDHLNELPNLEREGYIKAVNAAKSCLDTINYNINNKIKEIS